MADDFEKEFADLVPESDDAQADDFEKEFANVASSEEPALEAEPQAPAPPERTLIDYLIDGAQGLGDGASFGHGDTLGRVGATVADTGADIYDYLTGSPRAGATKVGRTAGDMGAELSDRATSTTAGQIGRGVGGVSAAVPMAMVAGPSVGAQAALGAAQGAAQAHGDDESMLGGALVGGALGTVGGLAGKGLGKAGEQATRGGVPSVGTKGDQALQWLINQLPSRAAGGLGGAAVGALSSGSADPFEMMTGAAKGAVGGALLPAAARGAVGNAAKLAPAARAVGQIAAKGLGGMFGDEVSPISKARAQDRPAATQQWAVQSVLYRGNSGLPPEAERRLTAAAMSGDPEKIATESFLLSSKYPAYRDSYRKTINKLSEGED